MIGAPADNSFDGAAWLFSSSGSSWSQQGSKLVPSDVDNSGDGAEVGFAVAASSDASTALIGAPNDDQYYAGAAWAYVTAPATVPDAPTGASAAGGNGQAAVSFTPPVSNGGATISSYTVTALPVVTASGSASPITVTGLTNGTPYTFTVTATNSVMNGSSAPSNQVTPSAPSGGGGGGGGGGGSRRT